SADGGARLAALQRRALRGVRRAFERPRQPGWLDCHRSGILADCRQAFVPLRRAGEPAARLEPICLGALTTRTSWRPRPGLAGLARDLLLGIDAGLAVRAGDRPQSIVAWRSILRGAPASAVGDTVPLRRQQAATETEAAPVLQIEATTLRRALGW